MDYRKKFAVEPESRVHLAKIDPSFKDKHESHESAATEIQKHVDRIAKLQYLLYADGNQPCWLFSKRSTPAARMGWYGMSSAQ